MIEQIFGRLLNNADTKDCAKILNSFIEEMHLSNRNNLHHIEMNICYLSPHLSRDFVEFCSTVVEFNSLNKQNAETMKQELERLEYREKDLIERIKTREKELEELENENE